MHSSVVRCTLVTLPSAARGTSATTSVTLSGHVFCSEHHFVLSAFARARHYTSPVWVPLPMLQLLDLPLRHDAHNPVRLVACNGYCFYYHVSQFVLTEAAMRQRWEAYVEDKLRRSTQNAEKAALPDEHTASQHPPPLLFPRNTNGERFARDVETTILDRFDIARLSPYWATVDEAAYLFDAPFHDSFVQPDRAVAVRHELCPWPVLYYNVSGSRHPDRFTPLTCRRYDPYNFCGNFYRPATALRLKRAALRYGCLNEPRWITLSRMRASGGHLLPHAQLVNYDFRSGRFTLVNVAMTSCVPSLFDHLRHPGAASTLAAPSPIATAVDHADEEECERLFVLPGSSCGALPPDC